MKSLLLTSLVFFGLSAQAASLSSEESLIVLNSSVIKSLIEMGENETDGCYTEGSIDRESGIATIVIACKSPDHSNDEGDSTLIAVEAKIGNDLKVNSVRVSRK